MTGPDPVLAMRIINYIVTPLSVIGPSIMLYFCLRANPRTLSIKLISALAVSDILYSLSNALKFFRYNENSVWCQIEAYTAALFWTSSIYFATSLSVLHYKFARLDVVLDQSKFLKVTLLGCIITSIVFSLGPLYGIQIYVQQSLDFSCYQTYIGFNSSPVMLALAYIVLNLPPIAAPIICVIFYIMGTRRARTTSKLFFEEIHIDASSLFWYPAVLFIVMLPETVFMTLNFFLVDQNIPAGFLVANFTLSSSIGLINATTYIIQKRLYRNKMRDIRQSALLRDSAPNEELSPMKSGQSRSEEQSL